MSKTASVKVEDLELDLKNYRTVPQEHEIGAIQAMVAISPDNFWALSESLVQDGYLPTENIIVQTSDDGHQIVKEGNRRIAALKLLLGLVDANAVGVPSNFEATRKSLSPEWIAANSKVPCNVYTSKEAAIVDRIVTRTHGKNAKAGRDDWESVATARHNRGVGARERALDLLEAYLENGTNLTKDQRARWAGKYKVTVLDEAIKRIATRCGYQTSSELVSDYPTGAYRKALEDIMYSIGTETLDFPTIRDAKTDFAARYGIPDAQPAPQAPVQPNPNPLNPSPSNPPTSPPPQPPSNPAPPAGPPSAAPTPAAPPGPPPTPRPPASVPIEDERYVRRQLRDLKLHGIARSKVDSLRKEALKLKLKDNPIAFCFLLRSLFELSAKAYCDDHKADGLTSFDNKEKKEKSLLKLLLELAAHMRQDHKGKDKDKEMEKRLAPAMQELGKVDGLFSITALNALVHNPNAVIAPTEIPILFGRVVPLLIELNS